MAEVEAEEADGVAEMQWMRSTEGKKWVRNECREARVVEARVALPPGRSCATRGSDCQ
jgi:hypothetical protein